MKIPVQEDRNVYKADKQKIFAEYVVIPEGALAHMPSEFDFDVATAIPLTGLTAYQAITEELQP